MVRFASLLVIALSLAGPAGAFDDAFKALGGAWDVDGGPIVFALDPAGSADIDDGSDLDAVRDAFRAWACVPGTKIRFEEDDAPGPRVMDLQDGVNTVFWDESGSDCLMGPGTLGITSGDVGSTPRRSADICFNGFHHTWGVAVDTDVGSIALHEIGHLIGLDHPCDNDANQASCLPSSEAVMFPSWSGAPDREPRASDIAGVTSLYPADGDDGASCDGPFRAGERCGCNDECVEGLVCIPDDVGELRCGRTCSASERDCGAGSACVLDVPQDGQDAVGTCVRAPERRPPGAICSANSECESNTCAAVIALRASICQAPCDGDGDCAGGSCHEGLCLGGFESEACPVADDGPSCGCAIADPTGSPGVGITGAIVVGTIIRRRRSR